jgi:ABC-type polysaccharide/polyol phosphate transport system ATPase subunit
MTSAQADLEINASPQLEQHSTPAAEPEWLIRAECLSKKYCRDFRRSLWYAIRDVAAAFFHLRDKTELRPDEFWAVKDISLTLRRGESLGLIGQNGAGKSTLLKMLTGQRTLTSGKVLSRGRVVALTELGLGFDPVLSGRENAYVNAAVFGVPRRQLNAIIDTIIDFAGLREFIDSAVQTYSSGMKARLGFSVAVHLNPDILIVDEVLAVGDIAFRFKCVKYIQGFLKRGGSLLLVSHDPYLVQTICTRCLVLERGRMIFDGAPVEAVDLHFRLGHAATQATFSKDTPQPPAAIDTGDGQTSDKNWLTMQDGEPPVNTPSEPAARVNLTDENPIVMDCYTVMPLAGSQLVTGGAAMVTLSCRSLIETEVAWAFTIWTSDLVTSITTCALGLEGGRLKIRRGANEFRCRIPRLPFCPGVYAIRGGIADGATLAPIALLGYANRPNFFTVVSGEATRDGNLQSMLNDLVKIQVEWLDD